MILIIISLFVGSLILFYSSHAFKKERYLEGTLTAVGGLFFISLAIIALDEGNYIRKRSKKYDIPMAHQLQEINEINRKTAQKNQDEEVAALISTLIKEAIDKGHDTIVLKNEKEPSEQLLSDLKLMGYKVSWSWNQERAGMDYRITW